MLEGVVCGDTLFILGLLQMISDGYYQETLGSTCRICWSEAVPTSPDRRLTEACNTFVSPCQPRLQVKFYAARAFIA